MADNIKVIEPEIISSPSFVITPNRRLGQTGLLPTTVQNRLLTSGGILPNIFGDGSDGVIVYSSNTTLTDDINATFLTINSGVVITTGGFRLLAQSSIINRGTIRHNGASAVDENQPGPTNSGTTAGGSNGGAGNSDIGNGGNSSGGQNSPDTTVFKGGNGGAAGAQTGGTVGGTNATGITMKDMNNIIFAFNMTHPAFATIAPFGGGSGGSGGGNASGAGTVSGAGGAGAGNVFLSSKVIDNSDGVIESIGGNGAVASGAGNAGGGGGGGGGFVVLIGNIIKEGTITVIGGMGGAKVGTGIAGSAGNAGVSLLVEGIG